MFKVLLAGLLFSQSLWAGLPPTSTKGQTDTAKSTTFDFQAPHRQMTKTSATAGLLETGNSNALKNPGFEATTYSTGWTASSGASAVGTSTNIGTGSKSYSWDASATSQTLTSDAVTIPAGWYGRNGEASCSFKTAATDYSLQAYDGTNIIATQTIVASTYFSPQVLYFPMPTSGTIALRLISASNAAIVYLDDCYLGVARSIVDNVAASALPTYLTATSSTKTPSATNNYANMTGSSVALTPGSWIMSGLCAHRNSGSSPIYAQLITGWYAANGADSSSTPALLTLDSGAQSLLITPSAASDFDVAAPTVRITVVANTTAYLIPYYLLTTAANARITCYLYAQKIQ